MTRQLRSLSGIISVLAILTLAGWYMYLPALHAPFVFDDIVNIVDNPAIRLTRVTAKSILAVRHSPEPARFFSNLTLAVNYYFDRYDITGYHRVNLAVHIFTALLVYVIARLTLGLRGDKNFGTPFLASVLWLVNPVHTQSVTYIVQRMNALSAMFVLLALVCYIQARRRQIGGQTGIKPALLLIATGLTGLCGLASKETAAILPAVIFLYEWFFFQDLNLTWLKKQAGRVSLAVVLLIIVALVYMGGHPLEKLMDMYAKRGFTPAQRLLTEPRVILYYLTLLFFPHPARLNLDYTFPLARFPINPATTLPAILALLALTAAAVFAAKKHRLLSFAIFWFLTTLAIESSFIGLALIFEHRTYLPSVFPVIAFTCFLIRWIKPRPMAVLMIGALIVLCGYGTYQRNRVWADALVLWEDNARKSPQQAVACNNLGLAYKNLGTFDKALSFSKKALALRKAQLGENHPATAESLSNVGLVYYRLGNYDEALAYLLKALPIMQSFSGEKSSQLVELYNNIGLVYDGKGDLDLAASYYLRALDKERAVSGAENLRMASIYNNLGSIWYNKGDFVKALADFQKALKIRLDFLGDRHQQLAECYNNIGLAYGGMGDYETAGRYYQQALDIELAELGVNHPYTVATFFNLGLTSYAQKNYNKAIFYMRKVLTLYTNTLGPNHPYIKTARSVLNEALLNSRGMPSTGNNMQGVEGSRGQGE